MGDVEFMGGSMPQFPIYRMPELARQVEDVEEYQEIPQPQQQYQGQGPKYYSNRRQDEPDTGSSNAYAAPVGGPDHVDYGAYTGGYGAFGWYTDHPVHLR